MIGFEVDEVDAALGVLFDLVKAVLWPAVGGVERDEAGVVIIGAIDRARAKAEDEADDAGCGVNILAPDIRVERESDARYGRVEVFAVCLSGDTHDKQPHLFIFLEHAAALAITEGAFAHGTGVDGTHSSKEVFEALGARPLIGAEDTLVFAGEGIAEVVFEKRA